MNLAANSALKWVLLPALCLSAQAPPAGSITGKVVDPTLAHIPAVEISLALADDAQPIRRTKADRDGIFLVDSLPEGNYIVTLAMPGFKTRMTQPIPVKTGSAVSLPDTILMPMVPPCEETSLGAPEITSRGSKSSTVEGSVQEFASTRLRNVAVSLRRLNHKSRPLVTHTNIEGKFVFTGIVPGRYSLTASLAGYDGFTIPFLSVQPHRSIWIRSALEIARCPRSIVCKPNRRVHLPVLCL